MQKITPFLWFDGKAEEAANFYASIFKGSKIVDIRRWGAAGPGATGSIMSATFQFGGQEMVLFNGGPMFTFSPATSFFVNCETQKEVDTYWEKLSEGGKKNRCGWLDDKFGVTWQIVPAVLGQLLQSSDTARSKRVMEAMLKMDKLNIKTLEEA